MQAVFNILIALGAVLVLGVLAALILGAVKPQEAQTTVAVEEKKVTNLRAFVRCSAGNTSKRRFTYDDAHDCSVAAALYGGMTSCKNACLGFGSCIGACSNGAISVSDGVAVVDSELCDGCGKCVSVCPRSVIELIPKNAEVSVACSNVAAEYEVDKICDVGCIGCRDCANTCEYGAIQFSEDLAYIDYEKCTSCGQCAEVCTRGVISAPKAESESEDFDENEYFEISEELEELEK